MPKVDLDTSQAHTYGVSEEKLTEFIEYRREIGKPIKTQRGVKQNLEQAFKASMELGIPADRAFDITMDEEWQGVKVEYIRNHLRATGKLKDEARQHNQSAGQPTRQSIASRIRQRPGSHGTY